MDPFNNDENRYLEPQPFNNNTDPDSNTPAPNDPSPENSSNNYNNTPAPNNASPENGNNYNNTGNVYNQAPINTGYNNGYNSAPNNSNVYSNYNPYNQNPYNQMPPYGGNNAPQGGIGKSITSMIFGIVATLFGCCVYYISLPLSIAAIVLGAISIGQNSKGKGMAVAGLVLGIVGFVFGVFGLMGFTDAFWEGFNEGLQESAVLLLLR